MAEDARYNIVFRGELVPGADPARVRENLGKLFKMDAARVEKLFAGKAVVLKKQADQATAMKMRAMMKKAGAVCEMQSLADDAGAGASESEPQASPQSQSQPRAQFGPPPEPAAEQSAPEPSPQPVAEPSSQSAPAPSSQSAAPGELETVGTIRTGGTGFSSEFEVAPAGSDMGQASRAGPEVDPDISHLSLAPPGTELEELPRHEAIQVPDISHLKVVDNPESDA